MDSDTVLILKQGAVLTLSGLTLGIIGSFALTRLLMGLLFEVKPTDPATYVIVSILLVVSKIGNRQSAIGNRKCFYASNISCR